MYNSSNGTGSERFIPLTGDAMGAEGDPNIDVDDVEFSGYGNISLAGDIDSMQQRIIGLDIPETRDAQGKIEIDNSDVVAQVIQRGNTVFQPNGVGVTPTQNAEMSKFSLAGPSGIPYFDDDTSYDIPQANKNSLDELLARAAQHRGSLAKRSLDGHVRATKNLFKKYFTNELDENERRTWYSAEAHNFETDFNPYSLDP
jgi:hypothetical protein